MCLCVLLGRNSSPSASKGAFPMYTLEVFYDGKLHHTERLTNGAEVLDRIPPLLQEHDGCEKIVVSLDRTRLFAVDCKGNRLDE